jgi:hypothetical protein
VPGEFIDAPVVVEASATALPPCSSVATVNEFAVHTAYSVVFDEIVNVDAAAREVPEALAHVAPAAGCVVHHPPKVYPDLVNDPVLPATVTVAPLA